MLRETIIKQGGITLIPDNRAPILHKSGFYVSIDGHEKRMKLTDDNYIFQAYLDRQIDRARHWNRTNGTDVYVGVWFDSDNAELVFDLTMHINGDSDNAISLRDKAIALGLEHNQQAIFDIAQSKVIFIREN